jgi:hypothetical protein
MSGRWWAAVAGCAAAVGLAALAVATPVGAVGGGGGGGDPQPDTHCIDGADGSMSASPSTVIIGQSVTISWSISLPAGCTGTYALIYPDNSAHAVGQSGSSVQTPSSVGTTTYWVRLTTQGTTAAPAGMAQITVQAPPPTTTVPPIGTPPPAYDPATCDHLVMCTLADVNGDGVLDEVGFGDSADHSSGFRGDALVWIGDQVPPGATPTYRPWVSWGDTGCDTHGEDCQLADMNRDGMADVVEFVKSSVTGAATNPYTHAHEGNVLVHWSGGTRFDTTNTVLVSGGDGSAAIICTGAQTCTLGDVNGDGYPDAVAFTRSTVAGAADGDVLVGLAFPGSSFPGGPFDGFVTQQWSGSMCVQAETCTLGDVNGDGRADAVSFVKSTRGGAAEGDVWVALSDPSGSRVSGSFLAATRWADNICVHNQVCGVVDTNGDGRADAVAKDPADTTIGVRQAWTGLSNGASAFGAPQVSDILPAASPTGATARAGGGTANEDGDNEPDCQDRIDAYQGAVDRRKYVQTILEDIDITNSGGNDPPLISAEVREETFELFVDARIDEQTRRSQLCPF